MQLTQLDDASEASDAYDSSDFPNAPVSTLPCAPGSTESTDSPKTMHWMHQICLIHLIHLIQLSQSIHLPVSLHFTRVSRHDICQIFYTSIFPNMKKFTRRKRVKCDIFSPLICQSNISNPILNL